MEWCTVRSTICSMFKISQNTSFLKITIKLLFVSEDLWCPQKYPDDSNASLAQECSRNEDCVPGFGCCWLEDCPNGQCCVELVKGKNAC